MCERTGIPPALVCTVGDLRTGQQYHDPNGETWMVVSPATPAGYQAEFEPNGNQVRDTMVVNIGNRRGGNSNTFGNALNNDELMGTLTAVRSATKLGYDRDGRLYSSTYLNGWYCDPEPVPEVVVDPTPDSVAPDAYDDDDAFPVDLGGES